MDDWSIHFLFNSSVQMEVFSSFIKKYRTSGKCSYLNVDMNVCRDRYPSFRCQSVSPFVCELTPPKRLNQFISNFQGGFAFGCSLF